MMAEAPTKTVDVDLETPDQIRAFLYEPAVLEGEHPSPYLKMIAAMSKSASDRITRTRSPQAQQGGQRFQIKKTQEE